MSGMAPFNIRPSPPEGRIRREGDIPDPTQRVTAILGEANTHAYRIVFSTPTVKPRSLPEFAYVSKELRFDSVVYSAIIKCDSVKQAIDVISEQWPDAQPEYAVQGDDDLSIDQTMLNSNSYGSRAYNPKSFWRKLPVVGLLF